MNLISDLFFLERIDYFIRSRATGTPQQLASRLGTSERNIYRLIGRLRDMGLPITYDKFEDSYYYHEAVQFRFEIIVGNEKLLGIKGGINNYTVFLETASFWQSDTANL